MVDFSKYPCFHLAYCCSDEEDQCLEFDHGLFSITLDRKTGSSIVILDGSSTADIDIRQAPVAADIFQSTAKLYQKLNQR